MEAKFYYECHVTIEPVFDHQLEHIKEIASEHGFKVASLLMKKREEDSAERSMYDTFMTAHGKHLQPLIEKMENVIHAVKGGGHKVWRYKIEDIVFDSRYQDEFNLLT